LVKSVVRLFFFPLFFPKRQKQKPRAEKVGLRAGTSLEPGAWKVAGAMLAKKTRMWSVGACAVSVTVLLAILHVCNGAPTFSDLLSGADLQNAELSSHLQNSVGEGGSQLADLIDSPLMLAKKKIDQYLNEDSDTASKMNVVGSKGGAPCTTLECDQGVFTNNYITKSEQHMEKVCSLFLSHNHV